jgi:hypothetical protein
MYTAKGAAYVINYCFLLALTIHSNSEAYSPSRTPYSQVDEHIAVDDEIAERIV